MKAPSNRNRRAAPKPPVEQAPAEQAPAEQAPAEQAPAEQASSLSSPARRLHAVTRAVEHDGVQFSPDSATLPAFDAAQFAQLKAVGAVEGEWDEGDPADA